MKRDARRLTAPRAVATGAALYTAVVVGGRFFVRARLATKQDARDEHTGTPEPRRHQTSKPGPKHMRARESGPPPSLRLPNSR
jgi:hypothetical protein